MFSYLKTDLLQNLYQNKLLIFTNFVIHLFVMTYHSKRVLLRNSNLHIIINFALAIVLILLTFFVYFIKNFLLIDFFIIIIKNLIFLKISY